MTKYYTVLAMVYHIKPELHVVFAVSWKNPTTSMDNGSRNLSNTSIHPKSSIFRLEGKTRPDMLVLANPTRPDPNVE